MPAPASSPFRLTPEGLLLFLRVTPNAGRDGIDGVETRDDGSTVLRVRVKAVPDKGKANAAVLALLAKALDLPKSSMTLVTGETARFKTVLVGEAGEALATRLHALFPPGPYPEHVEERGRSTRASPHPDSWFDKSP